MQRASRFVLAIALAAVPATAGADVVIVAREAPLRTDGGPIEGGVWNLWSNGRVGQFLRFARSRNYRIVVRAAGSPAEGVWPEMALLVDGFPAATAAVSRDEMTDYEFQVRIDAGDREIAAAFVNDRKTDGEDRNLYLVRITVASPPGADEPTVVPLEQWVETGRKRERDVLEKCPEQIEKHRKSTARVRVVDAAGKPVAGAKVRAAQTGGDFLFGCNIYMFDRFADPTLDAEYKRRFEEMFNYATTAFYWRSYERRRGEPDYARTDKLVDWCRPREISVKGHPLLWGDEAGAPAWSDGLPPAEQQRQRVTEIVERYRGKIDFWEVVNEPTFHRLPKIDLPYRWARRADPSACLIVNDCHVLADGRPLFFRLLRDAERRGVPFDAVGIQAHEPAGMWFPLDRVWKILDHYASLGKELHITEFTPTSGEGPIVGGYRQGAWDEAAQAEYAEKFYRVCFSHPAVRAITWWDLCDRGSWRAGGGMLRSDLTPKPVYQKLKRLISKEWKTDLSGATDADGRFKFRGFHGSYRIVVQDEKKHAEIRAHLTRSGANDWIIELR
ncbi:MAG: endo-1,4-beta-xylanase [Pirellulales bacterium]|nr:endo-1,4-beta-xylanase [Pirellulales bacterium]